VSTRIPRGQQIPHLVPEQNPRGDVNGLLRVAQIHDRDVAAQVPHRQRVQPALGEPERDRHPGAHTVRIHGAGIRVGSGGHVQGEDLRRGVVEDAGQAPDRIAQLAAGPGPEQRVHGDLRLPELLGQIFLGAVRAERTDGNPGLFRRYEIAERVRGEFIAFTDDPARDVGTPLLEVPRRNESISAVVALAAEDDDAAVRTEAGLGDDLGAAAAGALHEIQAGNPEFLDSPAVDLAHLGSGNDPQARPPGFPVPPCLLSV
jgi:hypothetical protein